jgi:hypothetical protein
MNGQETRALWEMGRDAWNEWASQILKSKTNFLEAGALALNWFGEADNDETRLWLKVASADLTNEHFEDEIDFEGFVFPGPVNLTGAVFERGVSFAGAEFQLPAKFGRAHFQGGANFKGTKFAGQTVFDDAIFDGVADFERAEFTKEKNGPLTHGVKFQRTRFMEKADFRCSIFIGSADFSKVQFAGTARFDEARFTADAMFDGAVFSAPAGFNACKFLGNATFKESQFTGEARFGEACFKGECHLDRGQFWGDASFRDAQFEKDASFAEMRIEGKSRFHGAKFAGQVQFLDCRFSGNADFSGASFGGSSVFQFAHFDHGGSWTSCRFLSSADFSGLTLGRNSSFKDSQFEGDAIFREARFDAPVSFASTRFQATADFSALQSKVALVLADADFKNVPSFLEASFHEPPRVDHMLVADPLKRFRNWKQPGVSDPRGAFFKLMKVCTDPDASAKFRRLKKLAFEAQDQTREQEFFAQELRCRRFWHDKPFGRGVTRFWLGWFYGGVANFGRSLLRPIMVWLFSIFVFSFYYLSQRGVRAPDRLASGFFEQAFGGLLLNEKAPCIAGSSSPIGEALYLSFRNAFLKLDWNDPSAAQRVFGCLYGAEPSGNVIVPLSVSSMSLFQCVVSAALIFMFLLALRNLLKVR